MTFCFTCVLFWTAIAALGLYFLRRFIKGKHFGELIRGDGKTAAVTGANCGIGMQTTSELNLRGFKVYMLCRSKARAEEAINKLVSEGCDKGRLIFVACDLSSFNSVRDAANIIIKKEQKLDLLINNAGCSFIQEFTKTEDGHELTWQSNYLSHFLLCELLVPHLEKAERARIVNVSSWLHMVCKGVDLKTIDKKESYPSPLMSVIRYNETKFAQLVHTHELADRLKARNIKHVVVNAVHPGTVDTNISRNMPFLNYPVMLFIRNWTQRIFFRTANDGAQTSLFAALSADVEDISGRYFDNCVLTGENIKTLSATNMKEFYEYSINAVKKFL